MHPGCIIRRLDGIWVHHQTIGRFGCIIKRLGVFGCIIKRFGILRCAPYGRRLKEQSNGIFVLSTASIHYSGKKQGTLSFICTPRFFLSNTILAIQKMSASSILRRDALSIYFFFINNPRPTNAIKARNP